ncbi:MAG: CRISPR-associated endonuclease Cas2 [Dehalococcoidia bacterium]
MELLVAYDVSTETAAGAARLRRVAQVCQAYGQRVQKSVFECIINEVQFELLKRDLAAEIDPTKDSVRVYRLREPHARHLWIAGRRLRYDLHGPLVVTSDADRERSESEPEVRG